MSDDASTRPGGFGGSSLAGPRSAAEAFRMSMLADTARFRADDPDELVAAALACPICLRGEGIEWHAALSGYDPSVECRCPSCDERWRVYVAPHQALRLGLMGRDR